MFLDSLRKWAGRFSKRCRAGSRGRRKPRRAVHLLVEGLEERSLLSVVFTPTPGSYAVPTKSIGETVAFLPGAPTHPYDPHVAVNPKDPGSTIYTAGNSLAVVSEADLTQTGIPDPTRFPLSKDGDLTTTVFDAQGRLFWANEGDGSGIKVTQVDPTSGAPIGVTSVVSVPPAGTTDGEGALAAAGDGSLYLVWTRFLDSVTTNGNKGVGSANSQVFLSRSPDQGMTWSTPVQVSLPADNFAGPASLAFSPAGDVYIAYHSQQLTPNGRDGVGEADGISGKTILAHSSDGGMSFTRTVIFGPGKSDVTYNVQSLPRTLPGAEFITLGSTRPVVLVDPVHPSNIYVIATNDPNKNPVTGGSNIVFARSTDNGSTWKTSPLESGPNNNFQLFPQAAIDASGDLFVAWYDNRNGLKNSAGHFILDVFAKYSIDGGQTWSDPFQVSEPSHSQDPNSGDRALDPDVGAAIYLNGPPATTYFGDGFGLDFFDGTAHVAFNRLSDVGQGPRPSVAYQTLGINGSLTISGDAGVSDDTITLRTAHNPDYLEVLVNGNKEYVGLWSALSGGITINGGSGKDTIDIENTKPGIPIVVTGGGGNETLFGPNTANTWNITGHNAGDLNGTVQFSGIQNLTGGSDTDVFQLKKGGSLDGVIDGGDGNNTLIGPDTSNTWHITGPNDGDLNGAPQFFNIENLTGGTGADTFQVKSGGSVSGMIDGGGGTGTNTLDYSSYSGPVTVDLRNQAATGTGGIAHIQSAKGGSGPSTLVGPDTDNVWHITGNDAGDVNGAFTFSNFGNLRGGAKTNQFVFSDGAGVSGGIDSGFGSATLDYSAYTTPVTVDLSHETATGAPVIMGIDSVTGGHGSDTLIGPSDFKLLPGQQAPLYRWDILSDNAGTLHGPGGLSFSSFENLAGGSGYALNWFVFARGKGVSGTIEGGGYFFPLKGRSVDNTLDYSAYDTPVMVNLATGAATGVVGGVSGIGVVIGGSGGDTLTGASNSILVGGTGNDLLQAGPGRNVLIGGGGADTILGGAGDDILVAGTTAYDHYPEALLAIQAEWSRSDETYQQRVDHLLGKFSKIGSPPPGNVLDLGNAENVLDLGNGKVLPVVLNAATVFADGAADQLTGGGGQDWFLADLTGKVKDQITDLQPGEIATDITGSEPKEPPTKNLLPPPGQPSFPPAPGSPQEPPHPGKLHHGGKHGGATKGHGRPKVVRGHRVHGKR